MMNRRILLLLLVLSLLPTSLCAQFFEKQKVVVWDVFDRNNDVKLSPATKQLIRTSIVDAFVGSVNYEAFEANIDDVTRQVEAKGLTPSPFNIAKVVRELHGVDFVIFTQLKVIEHSSSFNDFKVLLTSDLFSSETQKNERTSFVEFKSDLSLVPGACADLLGKLLRENIVVAQKQPATQQPQYQQYQQQPQYQQGQYQQVPQQPMTQDYMEAALGMNMKMVYVEGGTFMMGATQEQSGADSDESPVHNVSLDSYYISATEVTQAQWQAVMGSSIYQQASKAGHSVKAVGSDYPMYYVNWEEAQAFCRELSNITGKTYTLPTEAQWEYAARGGKKRRLNLYSGAYFIDAVAWYNSNSGSNVHPVGKLRANELGLYDMSGNVWEWCSDWHGSYSVSYQSNPVGPSSGSNRVYRGGSWHSSASHCRVANRSDISPSGRYNNLGFRVVCVP